MPDGIEIAAFVFGAILVLIAILGGNFKLFGAEIAENVPSKLLRIIAFVLGVALLVISLRIKIPTSTPPLTPTPPLTLTPTPTSDKSTITGTWLLSDPRVPGVFNSIRLSQDNQYQGNSWGKDFGGPNGLGANQYSFNGEILSFNYVVPGRARVDEMLIGKVKLITPTEIEFTVIGGYYGTGKNLGMIFRFKK
ncbi:MAG: hypothetical protein WCD18_24615 [Thermosynechococcaceae cyanobacterium]